MVKKIVVPKNKKPASSVEEKIEALAKEEPVQEAPPQMMQVVEITDEEEPNQKPAEVHEVESVLKEEVPVAAEVHDDMDALEKVEAPQTTEEKQHVVSEFFTKKERPTYGYPDISVHKKSPVAAITVWALGILFVVALIGFGIVSYSRGTFAMPQLKAQPTPTPTVAPTATPTPSMDKSLLHVQILNGSGTSGVAGAAKTILEEKGYTVAGTGNASAYDYEKTQIQVKADKVDFLAPLQSDLSGSYTIGTATADLKSSLPYDALVIIGKD